MVITRSGWTRWLGVVGLSAALAGVSSMAFAQAQEPRQNDEGVNRLDVWDLVLGSTQAELPAWIEFKGYACGSDGGPPLRQLPNGFADYMMCAPGPDGLREVYFEYDDEAEYILRAMSDPRLARYVGTTDKSFPVVTSALFDDDGVLRGVRVVTDPRPDYTTDDLFDLSSLRTRADHYLYAAYVGPELGIDPNTDCSTVQTAAGETPVGETLVKKYCERQDEDDHIFSTLEYRYLRKPGQLARNPITGVLTTDQFESVTRAELYQIGYGPTPLDPPPGPDHILEAAPQ